MWEATTQFIINSSDVTSEVLKFVWNDWSTYTVSFWNHFTLNGGLMGLFVYKCFREESREFPSEVKSWRMLYFLGTRWFVTPDTTIWSGPYFENVEQFAKTTFWIMDFLFRYLLMRLKVLTVVGCQNSELNPKFLHTYVGASIQEKVIKDQFLIRLKYMVMQQVML